MSPESFLRQLFTPLQHKRMTSMQSHVKQLESESKELTRKIELARTLPGNILETAQIPIDGFTVKD